MTYRPMRLRDGVLILLWTVSTVGVVAIGIWTKAGWLVAAWLLLCVVIAVAWPIADAPRRSPDPTSDTASASPHGRAGRARHQVQRLAQELGPELHDVGLPNDA